MLGDPVKFRGLWSPFRRARGKRAALFCAFFACLAPSSAAQKQRFEPSLLFGGGGELPPEPEIVTDPLLPRGAEIVARARPSAGPPSCSTRTPVCVSSTSSFEPELVLGALDAAEHAYAAVVHALGLPAPLGDEGRGGTDALDLYLVPSDRTTPSFERVAVYADPPRLGGFDRASGFCVVSADAGALMERAATLCVGEAIALRLDPAETPHTRRAFATELWWIVGKPTSFDYEAVDFVQRAPFRAIADRELSATSEGSAIWFEYLEESLAAASPGVLSAALLSASAQRTPPEAAEWHNEPDTFVVLRRTYDDNEHRMATTLGDFAVSRAFAGERDDGQHAAALGWAGAFGAPVFDWVLSFSKLPKRVPLLPIEPTGAAFVWLDLDRVPPAATLAFQAEWEPPAEFRWQLVKVDGDGHEIGRIDVPFQERETRAEARVVELEGARALLVVGAHLERVDLDHPFDPDVAPFEPHSALVYLISL